MTSKRTKRKGSELILQWPTWLPRRSIWLPWWWIGCHGNWFSCHGNTLDDNCAFMIVFLSVALQYQNRLSFMANLRTIFVIFNLLFFLSLSFCHLLYVIPVLYCWQWQVVLVVTYQCIFPPLLVTFLFTVYILKVPSIIRPVKGQLSEKITQNAWD